MPATQVSVWNGIVMGGGVGISAHAHIRVTTDNTVYAMPETGIGFFTDVGGSYFLSRLHDDIRLGLYLGLSGFRLKGQDLLQWGVATNYVPQDKIQDLYDDLKSSVKQESSFDEVKALVDAHSQNEAYDKPIAHREEISHCFQPDDVHNIFSRLQDVAEGKVKGLDAEWAQKTLKTLNRHSPLSIAVVFEQIKRGREMNLDDVFKMEYKISQGFMNHPEFFEGVRALLIDKDQAPKWSHSSIKEVTQEDVDFFFNRPEELNLDVMGDFSKAITG